MSKPTIISLDLAKKVIQVCKVNQYGELLFYKAMSPQKTKELLANSPPCIVAGQGWHNHLCLIMGGIVF